MVSERGRQVLFVLDLFPCDNVNLMKLPTVATVGGFHGYAENACGCMEDWTALLWLILTAVVVNHCVLLPPYSFGFTSFASLYNKISPLYCLTSYITARKIKTRTAQNTHAHTHSHAQLQRNVIIMPLTLSLLWRQLSDSTLQLAASSYERYFERCACQRSIFCVH